MRCKKRKHKWGRRVPRREIKLLHKRIHRGGTPRPHLCLLSDALMSLCLPRQRLPDHATASALMFLEATRTIVRGRQPRSGLVCILCKLMFLCFRGKRNGEQPLNIFTARVAGALGVARAGIGGRCGCRAGWCVCFRGRAWPVWHGGWHRPRGDGWRRCGAGCGGRWGA